MTAEIAIMNKQAVALAADSAVTYGPKIYNTANKLFMLSKVAPVGIMIYNNSEFIGIPWESLIKYFRNHILQDKKHAKLIDYVNEFIEFIEKNRDFFPVENQKREFEKIIISKIENVRYKLTKELKEKSKTKSKLDENDIIKMLEEIVQNIHLELSKLKDLPTISKKDISSIRRKYSKHSREYIDLEFKDISITNKTKRILADIFILLLQKGHIHDSSGIVISGFGEKEIFPNLYNFRAIKKLNGKFLHSEISESSISYDNRAIIRPFAQAEMPATFMEGIDPEQLMHINETFRENILRNYNDTLTNYIADEIKNKSIKNFNLKDLKSKLEKSTKDIINKLNDNWLIYRLEKHVNPIIDTIAALPKDELASVAESLVNLTSLKRKMSLNQKETVGGPIDVAVISKADGLVWINRKHYFDPKLNYSFFNRTRI